MGSAQRSRLRRRAGVGGIVNGYNAFSGTGGLGTGADQTSSYIGGTLNTTGTLTFRATRIGAEAHIASGAWIYEEVVVGDCAEVGEARIAAGAKIGAKTQISKDVHIGKGVIIDVGTTIDADVTIADALGQVRLMASEVSLESRSGLRRRSR